MRALYEDKTYNLIDPHTKEIAGNLKQRSFELIVEMAWNNGEPGIIFRQDERR